MYRANVNALFETPGDRGTEWIPRAGEMRVFKPNLNSHSFDASQSASTTYVTPYRDRHTCEDSNHVATTAREESGKTRLAQFGVRL